MERLGCTDLLDPYQNVIVGTDFLAEQLIRYGGDMGKALVAYNAGHYKGTIIRYAVRVLAKAGELRGTTYEAEKEGRTPG
jgi:soluble lytic murein transglycosylase-like protein